MPKPKPAAMAIHMELMEVGRSWRSSTSPTSATATTAIAMPSQASDDGRSPCNTPARTGTDNPMTAVIGAMTVIEPFDMA